MCPHCLLMLICPKTKDFYGNMLKCKNINIIDSYMIVSVFENKASLENKVSVQPLLSMTLKILFYTTG